MARLYSTKGLFRQIPNAFLTGYLRGRILFGHLDFSAMKEPQLDDLFAAWLALSGSQRNEMDAEFRDIFELSCENGFCGRRSVGAQVSPSVKASAFPFLLSREQSVNLREISLNLPRKGVL